MTTYLQKAQTAMSAAIKPTNVQTQIDAQVVKYFEQFESGEIELSAAHKVLIDGIESRTLIETAALAKAILIWQQVC